MTSAHKVSALKDFIHLEKVVRNARDLRQLSFIIANRSQNLLPYNQAIVWKKTLTGIEVIAISSTSSINDKSPYIIWLQKILIPTLIKTHSNHVMKLHQKYAPKSLLDEWSSYLPSHVMYCPFRNLENQETFAGVLFISNIDWNDAHTQLALEFQSLFEHAWLSITNKPKKKLLNANFFRKKRYYIYSIALLIVIGLLFTPVQQTTLAKAEIAPKDASLVSASIEGVIQSIDVSPNQKVHKGQTLFTLDKITLENKFSVAQKSLAVAEERYRKAYQDAYANPESKAMLAVLKAEITKAAEEVSYTKSLLERSVITAPEDGIIIFSSPKYWLGRPIKVGEQVMLLAPGDTKQLDIHILQKDMIAVQPGSPVKFFADVNPLQAIPANVKYASFVATPAEETQELEYFVVADFKSQQGLPRYGAHGTAKLFGGHVSLFFYLFKKPLVFIQSFLGL